MKYKKIKLSQSKYAFVDIEDYEWLSKWKWFALVCKKNFYAARNGRIGESNHTILMHRVIMSASKKFHIDHINHKTLDNRKSNLRICNRTQNNGNQRKRSGLSSRYKGVSFDKSRNKWESYITKSDKKIFLGRFNCEKKAAKVYNSAAKKYFGEFAKINLIRGSK